MVDDFPTLVFGVLAALAVATWLWGFRTMIRVTSEARSAPGGGEWEKLGLQPPKNLVTGSAEVDGEPHALSARCASLLAKQGIMVFGPVKILQQTSDRVVFEGLGQPIAGQAGGQMIQRGEFRFTRGAPGTTRIDYAIEVPSRSLLLVLGWLFVVMGFVAIVIACALIIGYALPNPNPDVRWQAVQMTQTGHFLWPPFLFAGIYRRARRFLRETLDTLAHNLPYLDVQGPGDRQAEGNLH